MLPRVSSSNPPNSAFSLSGLVMLGQCLNKISMIYFNNSSSHKIYFKKLSSKIGSDPNTSASHSASPAAIGSALRVK
jgi:hypothetical protein